MYRLLIVDDEEEIREGLASYFPWEEVGFRVVATAANGQEAFQTILHGGIDVALTDVRMPVMTGIELAQAVFRQRLRVTVVFLSAFRDFEYAQKAIQFGVKRYVLKPTDYREITSVFLEIKQDLDKGVSPDGEENSGVAPHAKPLRTEAVVNAVRAYVQRDYSRATLEGAAGVAHLNAFYLSRLFKRATGEPFNEFLMRVKMQKAAELLQDIGYTTHQVSEMVGYSSPKNFSRSFKRHFGVSPREYKRSSASESAETG